MRSYISLLCLFVILQSCSSSQQKEPFASLFKPCDQVNIVFYNNGDSLRFETKDVNGIKILTQLISGNKETLADTCGAKGDLIYLSKGQSFYTTQFAFYTTKGKTSCNYVMYNYQNTSYKHRLTERAENLLRQAYAAANGKK